MSTDSKSSVHDGPAARVATLRDRIDAALPALFEAEEPSELYAPARYVMEGGGKRVRPTLLLLVTEAFGTPTDRAMPAALAVELFHNFTLVHDDIMDASSERRGRETVHVRWDVGTAILVGDLLMGRSYERLARLDGVDLQAVHDVYDAMVERLCTGQALDKAFETRSAVTVDAYLDMIDGKTAALLSAVCELGAVVAGADAEARRALRDAGQNAGRAFQIRDDLLDVVADSDDWGKAVGGDLVNGKKTYVTLRALERADGDDAAWFARLVTDGGLPASDVPEARRRMERLGVFDDARDAVARYSEAARDGFDALPDGPAADAVRWLIDRLEGREH